MPHLCHNALSNYFHFGCNGDIIPEHITALPVRPLASSFCRPSSWALIVKLICHWSVCISTARWLLEWKMGQTESFAVVKTVDTPTAALMTHRITYKPRMMESSAGITTQGLRALILAIVSYSTNILGTEFTCYYTIKCWKLWAELVKY